MTKFNFSAEQQRVFSLAEDLVSGNFSLDGGLTKNDLENHLRETINKDIFGGLTFYQAIRRNKTTVFEVLEQITEIVVGENVLKSAFVEQFVEVKNRVFGDRTDWVTEGDSLLTVASFAGNHWDTNRQSFDSGEKFTLPSEWAFIHVYMEFERFMLGIETFEKLTNAITKSFEAFINERVFAQFHNIASAVPSEFVYNGNNEEAILELCEKLEVFGGYNNMIICGTQAALRKLDGVVPEVMIANSQKESRALTGSFGVWNGYKLMRIPQVKKNDAFELALDNNKLFIIGADTKPIKLEYIGNTRTKMIDDEHVNNDLTLDLQVQTKFALGTLLPKFFGVVDLA